MLKVFFSMLVLVFSFKAIAESIDSLNSGKTVEVVGFDCADESLHMIDWLGLGTNYRSFVISDVEEALYAQQPGSQLLKIECTAKPELLTTVLPNEGSGSKAILTKFSATFPLKATINLSGNIWVLSIDQNYYAENLDTPDKRKLTENFTVKGSEQQ